MGGSPEAVGDEVVISLSRKEGRKAKLVCMKEKDGEERFVHIKEAEEEFSKAFDPDRKSYYAECGFMMSPRAASAACRAIERQASKRKNYGEYAEYRELKSITSRVRRQIAMQGVVID